MSDASKGDQGPVRNWQPTFNKVPFEIGAKNAIVEMSQLLRRVDFNWTIEFFGANSQHRPYKSFFF